MSPPSNKIIATAKEMKMGKNSPSALGSKKLNPSGPKENHPIIIKLKLVDAFFLIS